MHKDHKTAVYVLANSADYPYIIVEYATIINKWFTEKREAVAFIAANRDMPRCYRRLYRDVENPGKIILHRKRWAVRKMALEYTAENMKWWHIYSRHHQNTTAIMFEIIKFRSMMELINLKDLNMLYTCIVAARTDDKSIIPDAQFKEYADMFETVRHVGYTAFPELVAWNAVKQLALCSKSPDSTM